MEVQHSESWLRESGKGSIFLGQGQNDKGCLGLFPDKVGRRHLPSSFNKNNIPSSRVIQNVKYRQNFKGEKKRFV